jgi:hypothetical protein
MSRTSRLRRQLNVVESIPNQHEPQELPVQELPAQEPTPVNDGDPDIDAISTGMTVMLRIALRLMRS